MEVLWRWFFRCVVGTGVLFAVFVVLLAVGMNRPNVTQSPGYTSATPEAVSATLSQSLPSPATDIRHCRASVGMGGRLLIYRFSAPVPDLHSHAQAEFASHWDKPQFKKTPGSTSPITEHEINNSHIGRQYSLMTLTASSTFKSRIDPTSTLNADEPSDARESPSSDY